MLTETQINTFKQRLEDEKVLLEKQLGELGTRNPSNPSDWMPSKPEGEEFGADRNDNADIIEEMQDNNASLTQLEARLNDTVSALQKIEQGSFGICEVSGEDIELDRLDANPSARTCKTHMHDHAS